MRILFVHQNFPGQYKHIAARLSEDARNEVVALASHERPVSQRVRVVRYKIPEGNAPAAHPLVRDFQSSIVRGEAAGHAALALKDSGFTPDILCGHPGWGEMLFLRDIWPNSRMLSYAEFYYRAKGSDTDFDPEFGRPSPMAPWKMRTRNATQLISFEASDWSVCPTRWQWQQLPSAVQERTSVVHDGVDTDTVKPNPDAFIRLGREGVVCRPGDELVTFLNRNLEPYRGYHIFMRALPEILRRRPRARVVIVGNDGVSYGRPPPDNQTYKNIYLREVASRLDMSRVHFVGAVPYATYLNLLQVSAAHVYLTYPFVLSWSMLEAMAAECLVIGSSTPPVTEVIEHEKNGLLVDFFSPQELAETVDRALEQKAKYAPLRKAARQKIVERYDLTRVCLPQHLRLIRTVAEGRTPAWEQPAIRAAPAGIPAGAQLS
jgi:glycosyltransferase involved in cell wall biosynthesis